MNRAAAIARTTEIERIVLGGILKFGREVLDALPLQAEDFTLPAHGDTFLLLRDPSSGWIPGNIAVNQAVLSGSRLAEKMGCPNTAAFDFEAALGGLGPQGVIHEGRALAIESIDRQRRAVSLAFGDGKIAVSQFQETLHTLDEREKQIDGALGAECPEGVPLIDYLSRPPNPEDELLGGRYLCREGAMLFVGPSGIGKSSAGVQQDVCWSVGRPAFGIRPARPLKIIVIQSENDAGDLHEMIKGVMEAMRFTKAEMDLCGENLIVISEKARTGPKFVDEVLAPALERYRPDIVRIDPLLAFLGGDPSDPKVLSPFCRNMINPLLEKHRCACVLNHHTPKTNNRDTSAWKPADWMYSGAGSADLTNWARAVLVIEPTANPHVFRFIAAKRGRRTGWEDEAGNTVYERVFCHSGGSIAWREATAEEAAGIRQKGGAAMPTDEELLAHVPITGAVAKDVLLSKWNSMGVGEKKCRTKLNVFLSENPAVVFEHRERRSGTRPRVLISRREQTLFDQ